MKRQILKYRFIITAIFITLIFVFYFNRDNYILMVYFVPKRMIELVFTLTLILANGYFLIDNIYYYVKMYNEIVIRSSKDYYYTLLLKKILYCFVLLGISQCILNYIACGEILLGITLLYFSIIISVFFILNRFLGSISQDILIIIFSFCIFYLEMLVLYILN